MILIATIASIIAAGFVARGKALFANSVWAVSNIFIIWHNASICEWEMVMLFGAYEIIAVYGIYYLWGKKYVHVYKMNKMLDEMIKEYNEEHDDE